MANHRLYPMSPLEIARGVVLDRYPPHRPPRRSRLAHPVGPRAALEQMLLEPLQAEPCVVAFSGGRDSSSLLAVATTVARREGLPLPVPVTRRFPALPETDESEWQELVVRHLGLEEWARLDLDDESLDLIGPYAAPRLLEHGVVWPPLMHADVPLLEAAEGGVIVDGEGGDQVFGLSLHRIEPLAKFLAGGRRDVRAAARAASVFAPAPLQRRIAGRRIGEVGITWLKPEVKQDLMDDLHREVASAPVSWERSVRQLPLHRARQESLHNRRVLAATRGVTYVHPFLEQPFIDEVAHLGGRTGLGSRTQGMSRLFGDVLPGAVLQRGTKASFNRSILGRRSRAFAAAWDGDGVDTDLVDPVALRSAWLAERPHARAFSLLQATWLSRQEGTGVPG